MKDLVDAVSSRVKSPYFGYAVFASIALNWPEYFLLTFAEEHARQRLLEFDNATNSWYLLVLPLLIGFAIAFASPWIRLFYDWVSKKPLEMHDFMRLEAQNKITIKEAELEQARNELFAVKESELIERAKRDEEISNITDEETKEKLSQDIEQLRRERESLKNRNINDDNLTFKLSSEALELLKEAANNKNGAIVISNTLSGRSIQVGMHKFGKDDQRSFVKYEDALELLEHNDLVREIGHKGEVFELTSNGWDIAFTL